MRGETRREREGGREGGREGEEEEERKGFRSERNLTLFVVEDLEAVAVIVPEVHAHDDVSKLPECRVEGFDELVVEPDDP